jgi:hypothetical protein
MYCSALQPLLGALAVKIILLVASALLLAGCAIRPLPEQSTGLTTFNIVKQIRCETREAIFNTFIKVLADNPRVFGEAASAKAETFRGHPELMNQFGPALFTADAREFVNFFWNTGIAYNFNLDMTETNNLDAQIDFLHVLPGSVRTLGLGGGLDRQRENTRTFTLTDDFKGLLTLEPNDYCDGHLATSENQIYPMTGKIGIEPFIHEFVRIALFTNLGVDKDSGAPTMVDTLQFQTIVAGSATPKIIFSPVARGFQLADASLTAEVTRKDIHTLTMGLSVVAPPAPKAGGGSNALFGRLLTSRGGGTRKSAADAVDQELTRQALSKTIVRQ